jgi:hypothetical protein
MSAAVVPSSMRACARALVTEGIDTASTTHVQRAAAFGMADRTQEGHIEAVAQLRGTSDERYSF